MQVDYRATLLRRTAVFGDLPREALADLAAVLVEEEFGKGDVVVKEGELGDRLFIIAEGRAEVMTAGPSGPVVLATLESGETFGEIALITPSHQRQATVTALTPLMALSLSAGLFSEFLQSHPIERQVLSNVADQMLIVKFLKQATPFTRIDAEQARNLAARLRRVKADAGETILREGEPGEACYLIRSGSAEVVTAGSAGERRLATLGAGALVGEAALMTEAPRNATVRAIEPCDLLELRRSDLMELTTADRQARTQVMELLYLRDRPCRLPHVTAHHRMTEDGDTVTILKDSTRGSYYQLSARGWFIWQRLDGHHTLRDLTMDYLVTFKSLSPGAVTAITCGLFQAGFTSSRTVRSDILTSGTKPSWLRRLAAAMGGLLEWRLSLGDVDDRLSRLYRLGFRLAYTRAGQLAMMGVASAGLLTFVCGGTEVVGIANPVSSPVQLGFLVPAYLFAIVIHETGHAMTIKHYGREVARIGVGWHWLGPVAYVDASDMWLAGRWPRIAVSLAGPYVNMVLAGMASIAAWLGPSRSVAVALSELALVSYAMVLLNLNPMAESDGYYVLMDWLDRPNLREHCLRWWRKEGPRIFLTPRVARGRWVEVLFGVGSFLFLALLGAYALALYRQLIRAWLLRYWHEAAVDALGWVLVIAAVLLGIGSILSEYRQRTPLGDQAGSCQTWP